MAKYHFAFLVDEAAVIGGNTFGVASCYFSWGDPAGFLMLDSIKCHGLDVVGLGRLIRFSMLSWESQQTSRSAVHVEVEQDLRPAKTCMKAASVS